MPDTGETLALGPLSFSLQPNDAVLMQCCGVSAAPTHRGAPFRTLGPAYLRTSLGRFEAGDFRADSRAVSDGSLSVRYRVGTAPLRYESTWTVEVATGVVRREDTLCNTGSEPVAVTACLARFGFTPADYELYCQSSRWVHENQGSWVPLHTGVVELGCQGGRTTQGSSPLACIRERGAGYGMAFHVLPRGNWSIRLSLHPLMHSRTAGLAVEIGQATEGLCLDLAPGQTWTLPTMLVHALADGTVESGCAPLHQHVNRFLYAGHRAEPPVTYNTWLDWFDYLDPERLGKQLDAAAAIGAEVFTVDAGWFAAGTNWYSCVGDWRECTTAAFRGDMRAFAAKVRAVGLKFGLWMEPERCGSQAPVRAEHPGYFVGGSGSPRYDIERPEVYAYLKGEIERLLTTYALDWIKIDYNAELGDDERGTQLRGYYDAWYRMLDELRAAHPHTFFEGCSSGGMRFDLESVRHYDDHFISDTCNAFDTVRIAEGARLRVPPGRIGTWAALQGRGYADRRPTSFSDATGEQLLTSAPSAAQPRQDGEIVGVDFAALAALPGVLGFSGDLQSLDSAARARVTHWVAFYKAWRGFIAASHAYQLTPVRPITDRSGWSAMQLCRESDPRSLVFVYRLHDSRGSTHVRLHELDPAKRYRVSDAGSGTERMLDGASLSSGGLEAVLARPVSAAAYVVEPAA